MPVHRIQAPDGKIIKVEAPEGATQEQIISFAQQSYAQQTKPQTSSNDDIEAKIRQREMEGPSTTASNIAGAVTRGVAPVTAGAAAGFLAGGPAGAVVGAAVPLAGDLVIPPINAILGSNFKTPTEAVDALLTKIGVPQAKTDTEKVIQAISGAIGSTGSFIKGGEALMQSANPVLQRIGQVLASSPGTQAISAGAGAGAGQAVQNAGGEFGTQLAANFLASVAAPAVAQKTATLATGRPISAAPATLESQTDALRRQAIAESQAKMVQEAGQYGKVLTSDVFPPETAIGKTAQKLGETIPFAGTGGVRAAQQKEREEAVSGLLRQYGANEAADLSRNLSQDLKNKYTSTLEKYREEKESVLKNITDDLDEKQSVAQKEIDKKYNTQYKQYKEQKAKRDKILEEKKYAETYGLPKKLIIPPKVKELVKPTVTLNKVPMTYTLNRLDEEIAKRIKENTPESREAANLLKSTRKEITDNPRTLMEVEKLRQQTLANPFIVSPTTTVSKGVTDLYDQSLKKIYSEANKDIGTFIKKNGGEEPFKQWVNANKKISDVLKETKNKSIESALNKGDVTPELVNNLLFSAKQSDVNALYRNLSDEGRKTAQQAILAKIAKESERTNPDGAIIYNPVIFNSGLDKAKKQLGAFFKGDELKRINGLSRYLTLTQRAQKAGVVTETGQQALPYGIAASISALTGSFYGTLAASGAIGGVARAFESEKARNLLINLGKENITQKSQEYLVKKLSDVIRAEQAKLEENPTEQQQ